LVYLHKQAVPGRSGTGNGLFLLVRNWFTSKFPIRHRKVGSNFGM
jgi:hypothetical protein